jgi:hypothetical protein
MKLRISALAAAAALAVAGCATEEGYRQQMGSWYGRMGDDLLIEWGNPQDRSSLSDGRMVWTYNRSSVEEQAGYYRDETRQVKRIVTDKDGKQREETITETFPVWQPPRTYTSTCTTRFILSPEQRIQDVTFNGNGCVAPES